MDAARILTMARRLAGLSQRELASRSRMPQSTISRVERGAVSPSIDTLERLLRACDQELEAVAIASDRELDWIQIDDHLDMSPADRARHAASAGGAMLQFLGTASTEVAVEDPSFDPLAVLRTLAARAVDFVVIGGFAASLRGSPVITDDVDICYAQGRTNRRRLADAIIELGARLEGVDVAPPFVIEDALEVGERCSFETTAGTLHTIASPGATRGYDDLVVAADWLDVDDCIALVPSLDDLVRMKVEDVPEQDGFALHSLRAVRKRMAVDLALNERLRGPGRH